MIDQVRALLEHATTFIELFAVGSSSQGSFGLPLLIRKCCDRRTV